MEPVRWTRDKKEISPDVSCSIWRALRTGRRSLTTHCWTAWGFIRSFLARMDWFPKCAMSDSKDRGVFVMEAKIQHSLTDCQQHSLTLASTSHSCKLSAMSISERIKKARERIPISQSELARRLGIRPQSVQMWEAGRNSPSRKRIQRLAMELSVSPFWLEFGGEEFEAGGRSQEKGMSRDVSISSQTQVNRMVPLISWVAAGAWSPPIDNYSTGDADDYVPCVVNCGDRSYALKVKGDSMSPEYPDGSVVIVDPSREPRHNADVIVRLNGEMETTFKRLKIDGSRWYLHPLNERYPVIPLEGKDFTICGTVIWTGREVC